MNSPGRIQALWMSFYSGPLYRAVAMEWRGFGFWYLVLVLALSWLPSPLRWYAGLSRFEAGSASQVVAQLPTVTIADGVMSADPPGRHEIRIPDSNDLGADDMLFLIIDDTIDEVPSDMPSDTIVLTRQEFGSVRPSRSERRVYTLGPGADMTVTPANAMEFVQAMVMIIPPIGYLGAFAASLIVRLAQLLLYGAVGLWFAKRRDLDIGYKAALRLSAVAMTPWIVIRTLLWFGPWEPDWYLRWPLAVAITTVYLVMGVRAVEEA